MYGIYANIWGILMVNVTIYGIHGSYGWVSPFGEFLSHRGIPIHHPFLDGIFFRTKTIQLLGYRHLGKPLFMETPIYNNSRRFARLFKKGNLIQNFIAGIKRINVGKTIINQSPNHIFHRWYVYHSQMGGLWHCFTQSSDTNIVVKSRNPRRNELPGDFPASDDWLQKAKQFDSFDQPKCGFNWCLPCSMGIEWTIIYRGCTQQTYLDIIERRYLDIDCKDLELGLLIFSSPIVVDSVVVVLIG